MSDDDKQHEYVPAEWRDIAVGTRDECRERLDAARAEANNMAEELRQMNALWQHDLQRHYALLLDVLAALKAAQGERDDARNAIGTLSARVTDSEALSRAANRACDNMAEALRVVNARLVEVTAERDALRERAEQAEAGRKKALSQLWDARDERDAALAALNKATAKRDWTHDFDRDVARLRGAQLTLAQNRIEELEHQLALSPPVRTFADPDFHKLIAERDAARAWAGAWKTKAKQLRSKCNEWQTDAEARSDCCIELDAADRWLAELRARVAELEAEREKAQVDGATEKVPAVPLGQALNELNQTAGELAEVEDDDDIEEWQLDLARLEAVTAMFHAEQPDPCAAVRAELDAARQSRKRAVGQSRMWKTAAYLRWAEARASDTRLEVCGDERDAAVQAALDLRARAEAAEAGREALIAKIASMANERDMFAAKVNRDMDELVAATTKLVRAINRKSFLDVRR